MKKFNKKVNRNNLMKKLISNKFIKALISNKFMTKIMSNKFVQKVFTKEIILYAFFGVLTTLINIGSFYLMTTFLNVSNNLANNIAIIIAVLVAYITNKDMVFHSQAEGFKEKFIEFCKFILGRLFTMVIESIGGALLFKYVPIPSIVSKCIITVVVIILNFFISKFFTFKRKKIEEN